MNLAKIDVATDEFINERHYKFRYAWTLSNTPEEPQYLKIHDLIYRGFVSYLFNTETAFKDFCELTVSQNMLRYLHNPTFYKTPQYTYKNLFLVDVNVFEVEIKGDNANSGLSVKLTILKMRE